MEKDGGGGIFSCDPFLEDRMLMHCVTDLPRLVKTTFGIQK